MKRVLYSIYAYGLFRDLVFLYPLYAVMFSDAGVSPSGIGVLLAVWTLVALVLEVPSGAVADKYPRKYVLLFSQMSKTACFVCWLAFPTFWGFMAGFVCWGTASAFASGTFEAFVFDELKHFRAENQYAKVIGRVNSIRTVAVVLASLAATVLARFGIKVVTLASILSLVVGCVSILLMKPAKKVESTREAEYFALLKEGVREAVRNRVVLRLIVFMGIALPIFGELDEYWPLFGKASGVQTTSLGLMLAGIYSAQALAGAIAHRFERVSSRAIHGGYVLGGVCLAIAAWLLRPVGIVFIGAFCFLLTMLEVILGARLQRAIEVNARATVTSVSRFLGGIVAVPTVVAIGLAIDWWGYTGAFYACAGFVVLVGAVYSVIGRLDTRGLQA